jgi:hypothetical protein
MNAEMDGKVAKILDDTTALLDKKIEGRLEEKWPEYRETDSAARRKEILVAFHRRQSLRWSKAWLPGDSDRELRAAERVFESYLELREPEMASASGADAERAHRVTVQGLVYLGQAMARVLRMVQGANREARLAAIESIAAGVAGGGDIVDVLMAAESYEADVRVEQDDPNDVLD